MPGIKCGSAQRLAELKERAAAVAAELKAVEQAIAEEQGLIYECKEDATKPDRAAGIHHRPSYSLFGGSADVDSSGARVLNTTDGDFDAVLKQFPKLDVSPIGSFDHWDRRECAVANPDEWRQSCKTYMEDLGGVANIPKVIHQIWVGPKEPPCLWIDTFRVDYLEKFPDWGFKMWSDAEVVDLPMLNRKIYDEEKMWQCKADILRLEFLWHHGGMYVDADMISVDIKSLDPIIEMGKDTGFVIAYEPDTKDKPYSILGNSVIACTPHHPLILMLILFLKQTFYQKRNNIEVFAVTGPVMYTKCLVDSNMPMSIAPQELLYPAFHFVPNPDSIDYSRFPKCLMFQFGYTCSGLEGYVKKRNTCKKAHECSFHSKCKMQGYRMLADAKSSEVRDQVPIGLSFLKEFIETPTPSERFVVEDGVAMFITDGDLANFETFRREVVGYVDGMRGQKWDVMLIGVEWSTGSDESVVFNVPPGGRPRDANVYGFLLNVSGSRDIPLLKQTLKSCITTKGFDPSPVFDTCDRLSVWFVAQKFAGTMAAAEVFRNMPVVSNIFEQLAGHHAPLHYDRHEVHENCFKGFQNGNIRFEMVTESNGNMMFRSWNEDSSINCEMKTSGNKVEWMKVFCNHQVIFEAQDKPIPE